mmetsp:Transcript_14108/g.44157  ORF Transcript_14108/g.44157 Transcript_14108/m.44157 type:complete len:85 (+) Transcript_14108:215-469(+)
MRGFSTAAARAQGSLDGSFLAKLGAVCFAVGAGMELFMIKTGFYDKVVQLEADRIREYRRALAAGEITDEPIDIRKLLDEKFKR